MSADAGSLDEPSDETLMVFSGACRHLSVTPSVIS